MINHNPGYGGKKFGNPEEHQALNIHTKFG